MDSTDPKYLLIILGPTAAGKTEMAFKIALHFDTEIVSADSRQFFREISIGTAKPDESLRKRVRHHFIDTLSIRDNYNVARFEEEALGVIAGIHREKDVAVMAGGSGFYIDAVCKGIDEFPDADPEVRSSIKQELDEKGLGHLLNRLKELDRAYYDQVDRDNPMRIRRALEVCIQTGRPYSAQRIRSLRERPFQAMKIGLELPRKDLYDRIDARVDLMIERGLVEEARAVYPFRHLNSLNTVGYKELFDYFDGFVSLEQAIKNVKTSTRRYAKRQITWFKRDEEVEWFDAGDFEEIMGYIERKVIRSL